MKFQEILPHLSHNFKGEYEKKSKTLFVNMSLDVIYVNLRCRGAGRAQAAVRQLLMHDGRFGR